MNTRLPLFFVCLLWTTALAAQPDDDLHVHCIDVGQGAATLLEFPCGAVLIDAGAQDDGHADHLMDYLGNFFNERPDLDSTLALIIVTHCHLDHNSVLRRVAETFRVQHYIDNGWTKGSGKANQNWLRSHAAELGLTYASYTNEVITSDGNHDGLTNAVIDPLQCTGTDPVLTLLFGPLTEQPAAWSNSAFKNGNNHSLVVRVDYGEASLLFPGDLELEGLDLVLAEYGAGDLLDADLLLVSHHGSDNGTSVPWLQEVSPTSAVISCGHWNSGVRGGNFTTYAYGHPRADVVQELQDQIIGTRSGAVTVKVGQGARSFTTTTVRKRVYSTAWDGNLVIDAKSEGSYRVNRNR